MLVVDVSKLYADRNGLGEPLSLQAFLLRVVHSVQVLDLGYLILMFSHGSRQNLNLLNSEKSLCMSSKDKQSRSSTN